MQKAPVHDVADVAGARYAQLGGTDPWFSPGTTRRPSSSFCWPSATSRFPFSPAPSCPRTRAAAPHDRSATTRLRDLSTTRKSVARDAGTRMSWMALTASSGDDRVCVRAVGEPAHRISTGPGYDGIASEKSSSVRLFFTRPGRRAPQPLSFELRPFTIAFQLELEVGDERLRAALSLRCTCRTAARNIVVPRQR